MILLDTNVISEPWRTHPSDKVLAWLDAQDIDSLFLSTITVAELRFGVALMPPGKRRTALYEKLELEILPVFTGRVLDFDLRATQFYAELMAAARLAGKAIGQGDGQIAAIAKSRRLTVASRDVSPFVAANVAVIDPWN